jgi:hypothetical protein
MDWEDAKKGMEVITPKGVGIIETHEQAKYHRRGEMFVHLLTLVRVRGEIQAWDANELEPVPPPDKWAQLRAKVEEMRQLASAAQRDYKENLYREILEIMQSLELQEAQREES